MGNLNRRTLGRNSAGRSRQEFLQAIQLCNQLRGEIWHGAGARGNKAAQAIGRRCQSSKGFAGNPFCNQSCGKCIARADRVLDLRGKAGVPGLGVTRRQQAPAFAECEA